MKKLWIGAGGLLLAAALVFVYFKQPAVETGAQSIAKNIVLSDKTWNLEFSQPLKKLSEDAIYVKDQNGEKISVKITMSDDRKSVLVHPPEDGYSTETESFTLHISSEVKSSLGLPVRGDNTVEFAVVPTLPEVKSQKDLQQYFKYAIKREKENRPKFSMFNRSASEDSADDSGSSADGAMEAQQESSSNEHSTTNNQVQGVDEADIVKTDGTYIYQIASQQLVITKAEPVSDMEVVSSIPYENNFSPQHLFLQKDKLIVIGNSWNDGYRDTPSAEKSSVEPNIMPMHNMMKTIIYDISDKEKPDLLREFGMEGNYVSARKVGSYVYLAANHYPDYWMLEEKDDVELRPRITDSLNGQAPAFLEYEDIKYMPQSTETNFTLLAAIDLEKISSDILVESYLGSGHQIYMSKENLYMALSKYNASSENPSGSADTEVYKFAIDQSNIEFAGMANVRGTVLNQFSMDEHDGNFRIATTKGNTWGDDRTPSTNNLYILDENLNHIGKVEDLAKGERIYSVRFMGDKAYMVTFKQVDPLFVIDTSDPYSPEVLGELKIPGFSNYLHPLDENHLIGFGYDTKLVKDDKMSNAEPLVLTSGMKISLFDVSDFHNPKEKDTEIIGGRGTHSYLMDDHKALFQHKDKSLFGFPVSVYQDKEGSMYEQTFDYQGALVYEITPENGIVRKAQMTNSDEDEIYERWEHQVQRMLYIGENLYTISPEQIRSYKLNDFTKIGELEIQ
ncbi:beta-propeller domain-containing protein [Bacillus sp. P14.5]|uniref:beta-propeller domain-containing protein n=1 Tax=Bacillus sp. P14.5 TaxID=1983400 RepID=UPI0013B05F6B|nr:beta-propeller domain-containing protein [Bacillus sp. P14.5]